MLMERYGLSAIMLSAMRIFPRRLVDQRDVELERDFIDAADNAAMREFAASLGCERSTTSGDATELIHTLPVARATA